MSHQTHPPRPTAPPPTCPQCRGARVWWPTPAGFDPVCVWCDAVARTPSADGFPCDGPVEAPRDW